MTKVITEITNSNELDYLKGFLESFRKAIIKHSGKKSGFAFLGYDMLVLNNTYYVQITDYEISIRSENKELYLSRDFYYYEALQLLLEYTYYNQRYIEQYKEKPLRKIDFLLRRMNKRYSKIINETSEKLNTNA